ncbi:acetylxylan esterase [Agromyces protaetiae]|uniref:Acetylxylan esterase n=1 Tax=Agromyces protaetiae TaxID=2509455 RepID=A0A4P6F9M2_9MICO|nr:acetylxylan esterase [Agromyces protaetiae]QAY72305.1 acetylxylan esterase [Agromyces protaetiae]
MPRFDLPLQALRAYLPEVDEPTDFDGFWAATLRESRAAGATAEAAGASGNAVVRTPVPSPLALFDVEDVRFPGFAGDPVRAWLVLPRGLPRPLPAVVEFVGYGRGRGLAHERLHWPSAGYAQLIVDTRGQGSQYGTGGATPDPHGSGPAAPGFLTRGIDAPETYYYRRVFTDAVRAIDAVRTFPEIDPAAVAVVGNSQGGAIAIAAAGLSDGLVAVLPSAPILSDLRRVIGLTGEEPYAEIVRYLAVHRGAEDRIFETLSYFDGVSFAKRATAPALFSTGHMDTIAPPSGVYAAKNHWGAPAELVDYPWNHHEGGESVHWERQAEWLAEVLAYA